MKPEGDQILGLSAQWLGANVVPNLGASYLQGTTGLTNILLALVAQEYERGADIRATENAELRALFAELAPGIDDAMLRAKLDAAAATRDDSLKISVLNAANAELRRLLIALQIRCEQSGAQAAEKRIWAVLQTMAERRFVTLPV
jgi:hypothetical protein